MIGKQVSHYRVIGELGSGGMGVVYEAEDITLGRRAALKFLPERVAADKLAVDRFLREARAAAVLNHPGICTVYEVGTHDGRPFIAMERLQGKTLREWMAGKPVPAAKVIDLAIEAAEALDAAHARGIVHRDIKPSNIVVTDAGHIKILDFGLAKFSAAAPKSGATSLETAGGDESLTNSGTTVGTVAYMSPEQIRGDDLDGRSDLFSLGIVIYEMVTGKEPFSGKTSGVIFDAILNRAPVPPARFVPEIPPRLEDVVHKLLEKDRSLRYQSAAELIADLRRLKRDSDSSRTLPVVDVPRKRAPALLRGLMAIALVGVVVAGIWMWRTRNAAPPMMTDKDSIVLTDFVNTTGEPVFDGTLKTALSIKLAESPFLNLVSDAEIMQTLKLMKRPDDERITRAVGREVCNRLAVKAMMTGEIAALGSHYAITLKATNCSTGVDLATEQVEATGKEDVLRALGSAATEMRAQLGESVHSIPAMNKPLEKATTSSLDALKAFSDGDEVALHGHRLEGMTLYRQAIDLDPTFAMAYARLGVESSNSGQREVGQQSIRKAYDLRDRVSEREKYIILDDYYLNVTGELEAGIETLIQAVKVYPRNGRIQEGNNREGPRHRPGFPLSLGSTWNRPRLHACRKKDEARHAYQDFFEMWKSADPDLPVLLQAKAEYERLPH